MIAASLLHDRKRTPHASIELKIAQHQHAVGEIADVERRIHRSDKAMLRQHQDGQDATLTEIAQQFVHLQNQEALIRHRVEVAVKAIDDHDLSVSVLNAAPHGVGELARSHFSRINLLNIDQAFVEVLFEWQTQRLCARGHRAASFVEGKDHGALVSSCGGDRIGERKGRFADAR